jgi:hypothetical protein
MGTRITRNLNDAIDNIYEELNEGGGGSPKMYLARFAQSGTSNPVVNEFLNTTGLVFNWVREQAGRYYTPCPTKPYIGGKTDWTGANTAILIPKYNNVNDGYIIFWYDDITNRLYLYTFNDANTYLDFSAILGTSELDLPAIYLS